MWFEWGNMLLTIEESTVTLEWHCERFYKWEMKYADIDDFIDFCNMVLEEEDEDEPDDKIVTFSFEAHYFRIYLKNVRAISDNQREILHSLL